MVLSVLDPKAFYDYIASIFLAVLPTLDPKAFGGYIISVLPLGIGIGFLFRGIIGKLN